MLKLSKKAEQQSLALGRRRFLGFRQRVVVRERLCTEAPPPGL